MMLLILRSAIAPVLGLLLSTTAHGLSLIPVPVSIQSGPGQILLANFTQIQIAPQLVGIESSVNLLLSPSSGLRFETAGSGSFRFHYDSHLPESAYRLQVSDTGIDIHASATTGAFYALQTLRQLLPPDIFQTQIVERQWPIPHVDIKDYPRFDWRGLHLDVARHYMPVDFIKRFIDLMAQHKLNRFHWHLTDDQGWRIEIKRYPKLTEVGAWRDQTIIGNPEFQDPQDYRYDGVPHGGFYTQNEVKDIVAYAAKRQIEIVPEIEFPGHAQAVIAAYPELGITQETVTVMQEWGISTHTLRPSEKTLAFYRNVLTEVMALFPSRYIHIGGDEVDKTEWQQSELTQSRMRQLGLKDTHELQSWLIRQIDQFLAEHDRQLIGWDEIMQGGLSDNAVVMSWRGIERGLQAAALGNNVIMAPYRWTYFDYYQASPSSEPFAYSSYLPLADVYKFDPAPKGLSSEIRQRILGAQAQLWTEYISTPSQVEYMAFPRAVALAEVLWSPQSNRDLEDFQRRLPQHLQRLDVQNVNYRPPGNDELNRWEALKQFLWNRGMELYHWIHDNF